MKFSLPPDKSLTHRVLFLSPWVAENILIRDIGKISLDIKATIELMRKLGVEIKHFPEKKILEIENKLLRVSSENESIVGKNSKKIFKFNCLNSGTTVRLAVGYLTNYQGKFFFTGDKSLKKRPMERVTTPLKTIWDVKINLKNNKTLPLCMEGEKYQLKNNNIDLQLPSAQVKSSILLSFLFHKASKNTNNIKDFTLNQNQRTRDHTELLLKYLFPQNVKISFPAIKLKLPFFRDYLPEFQELKIPGDPSSAAFLTAAFLGSKEEKITFRNLLWNPTRNYFFRLLEKLQIINIAILNRKKFFLENSVDITIERNENIRKNINLKITDSQEIVYLIDEFPILTILVAYLKGKLEVRNAQELRYKESNRISLLVENLKNIGYNIQEYPDGFFLDATTREKNKNPFIKTHDDHRILISFIVLEKLLKENFTFEEKNSFQISFPEFLNFLNDIFQ